MWALIARRDARRARAREIPTVALAGYTNVGKSTLLNALTGAEVSVENRLFETLDPTTRTFEHHGKRYLVTDTVGFIRRLPTQLVEGFASTLEETLVADLVLHVVDGSLSEEVLAEQIESVETVLAEIGAGEIPVELVVNKVDRLDLRARRRVANRFPGALEISAATGEGIDELQGAYRRALRRPVRGGAAARPLRRGPRALRPLRARGTDRRADGHRRGRRRPCAPSTPRGATLRAVPRRGDRGAAGVVSRTSTATELAVKRLRPDAVVPAQAYAGDAGFDLAACERVELGAGGARRRRHRDRASRSRRVMPGFVVPRSGLAARHGISVR